MPASKQILFFLFTLLGSWLAVGGAALAKMEEGEVTAITVLADRALTIPLAQIASDYSSSHHLSVNVSFAPSFEQTMAVEAGEPADVFITAHPKALEDLKQRGVFDVQSITPLVSNRLVWISSFPAAMKPDALTPAYLTKLRNDSNFLLAVATASASAEGYYTEQAVKHIKRHIFLADATVQLQNTPDIMNFLAENKAFAIVFASDLQYYPQYQPLAFVPKTWCEPPVFTGGIVIGGAMDAARAFLQHLQTPEAQKLFLQAGFLPIPIAN
jgi:molybdate transport system substrate-binding protein